MPATPVISKSQSPVNTFDGGLSQRDSQIVGLLDGGYVVVWEDNSHVHNAAGSAIAGQRFNSAGEKVGEWEVGDFNGDGRADIFSSNSSGTDMFLSDGAKFVANFSWTPAGPGSDGGWYTGDYRGDGISDIFRHRRRVQRRVSLGLETQVEFNGRILGRRRDFEAGNGRGARRNHWRGSACC